MNLNKLFSIIWMILAIILGAFIILYNDKSRSKELLLAAIGFGISIIESHLCIIESVIEKKPLEIILKRK